MNAEKIKQHAMEWRCLGDILIKHDFLYSEMKRSRDPKTRDETARLLRLAAAKKRRGKRDDDEKEKKGEAKGKKKVVVEEKKRFSFFGEDFLSNLMVLPAELIYPILEQMLMPHFLKAGGNVDIKERLSHAVMEVRRLDKIFTHFSEAHLKNNRSTIYWQNILISERMAIYMYTAWFQHPTSSFRVPGFDIFHGEPFSEAEFKELRLVELMKMNLKNPFLWYRSFLANVLFNWHITEAAYSIFSIQAQGKTYFEEHKKPVDHWPGALEVMSDNTWHVHWHGNKKNGFANILNMVKYNIKVKPKEGIFQPDFKFLLEPWEADANHWPYEAVASAFMASVISMLGDVTLIRIPSILWNQDYLDVFDTGPAEELDEDTIYSIPITPIISGPSTSIKPFVVFDPPVKAYKAKHTHGLLYSIGQINLSSDQHLFLENVRFLSSYNITRAMSLFHATSGIRLRGISVTGLRMKNDRPGPFIILPASDSDYDDEDREELVVPDTHVDTTPPEVYHHHGKKVREYKGIIQEESFPEITYQKSKDFEDIVEKDGNVPKWLQLVLREPEPEKEKQEEEEEEEEKENWEKEKQESQLLQAKRAKRDREYRRLREEDDRQKGQGMSSSKTTTAKTPPPPQFWN